MLVGLLASGACGLASANEGWQWLDDTGRKVFSDMPPPASVPEKRIIKRPGVSAGPLVITPLSPLPSSKGASPPQAASTPTGTPVAGTNDSKAANKPADKSAASAATETEKERKAQEQRNAVIRADNCQRARSSQMTLESGMRMMVTSPQGEQIPMDDSYRQAELARVLAAIQENCR